MSFKFGPASFNKTLPKNIGKVPVIIPSYNNRKPNILEFVSNGDIFQERECHIYIQKDQENLYSEYKNVIVHIVPDEYATSIRKKRHYILDDFKEDLFWFLDDDTNKVVEYYDEKDDHTLTLDDAMKIIENDFDIKNDGAANINIFHLKWHWRKYGHTFISNNTAPSNIVLLNAKVCRDNNIQYPEDDYINEDTIVDIKLTRLGYRCWTHIHMFCKQMVAYGSKDSLATHDRFKSAIADYIAEGDAFCLHTKDSKNHKDIVASPQVKKVKGIKQRRYNKKLFELCKVGNEKAILDYLKDYKYNSRYLENDLIYDDDGI